MPPIPQNQTSPHPRQGTRAGVADAAGESEDRSQAKHCVSKKRQRPAPSAEATPHQRQSDRSSAEDAEARLRVLVRFKDLKASGVVGNWPTLLRLIDDEGFPAGFLLGKNMRAWALDDIARWLDTRPTARKIVPRRNTNEAA